MVIKKKTTEEAPVGMERPAGSHTPRRIKDLTEGPILSQLIYFCLPLMLTGMMQLLYNATDMIVVGQFDSSTAVGAVGASGALINLIVNLFMGLSVGVSVTVAQHIGARQYKDVEEVVHTALALGIVSGIAVGIFGFFFAGEALRLMDTPADTLERAIPYVKAYMTGIPACMVYNYCAAVLRAKGDTVRPLIILGISGLFNVGLNIYSVVVLHWSAMGVGIATSVSQYISMGMILVYMTFLLNDSCRIHWSRVRFHGKKVVRILQIGLPAGIQGTLFSISNVLIQASVNSFGSSALVDGNAAASNIDGFIYTAQNSVYHGAITFVGQHVGARKFERLNRVIFSCMGLVTAIGLLVGSIAMIFATPLLEIYIPGAEVAIAWGKQRLILMGFTYFLCGLMEVGCGSLRGMGKTILPMVISLVGSCGLRIVWIYTIFQWNHTMMCLYWSYPVSWLVTAAFHFFFTFRLKAKLERENRAAMLNTASIT